MNNSPEGMPYEENIKNKLGEIMEIDPKSPDVGRMKNVPFTTELAEKEDSLRFGTGEPSGPLEDEEAALLIDKDIKDKVIKEVAEDANRIGGVEPSVDGLGDEKKLSSEEELAAIALNARSSVNGLDAVTNKVYGEVQSSQNDATKKWEETAGSKSVVEK